MATHMNSAIRAIVRLLDPIWPRFFCPKKTIRSEMNRVMVMCMTAVLYVNVYHYKLLRRRTFSFCMTQFNLFCFNNRRLQFKFYVKIYITSGTYICFTLIVQSHDFLSKDNCKYRIFFQLDFVLCVRVTLSDKENLNEKTW